MKKYILITLLAGISTLMVSAQSFTLSPRHAFAEGPNSGEKVSASTITNVSSDANDTMFSWTIIHYSVPQAWITNFCDPKDCYVSLANGYSKSFKLKKGDSGPVKSDFVFNNAEGSAVIQILISSNLNPSNYDTLTLSAISWKTGISTLNKPKALSFYPNPVKDQITINFPTKDLVQIDIYNVLGSLVKSFTHDSNISTINVSELQKGVYFIRVKDKNTLYSKSFNKAD